MKNITLNNFRVFDNVAEFKLPQITILTGRNNSGKSSVIKALLLLEDYLNSQDHFYLNFFGANVNKHKITDFENAINWDNPKNLPYFTFKFKNNSIDFEFQFIKETSSLALLSSFKMKVENLNVFISLDKKEIKNTNNPELVYELKFTDNIISYFDQLRNLEKYNDLLKDEERNEKENTNLKNKGYIVAPGRKNLEEIEYLKSLNLNDFENYEEEPTINQIEIEYSDFRTGSKTIAEVVGLQIINFDSINANEQITKNEKIIENQNLKITRVKKPKPTNKLLYDEFIYSKLKNRNAISSSFSLIYDIKNLMRIKVNHLSPNRTRQDILYLKTRMNDTDIERVLAEYDAVPFKDSDPHQKFLSYWLKEFGIGDSIKIETTKGIAYDVQIKNNKRIVSLVDMGFGTGQIITILIQLSTAIRTHSILINRSRKLYRYKYDFDSSYIIIEEPESNLHPQFQAKMAELIVECLKYGIKFILETHSEYFIGKFQVLVAESLKKENKLQKENIVIYYINDKTDDKTYLKEIFINNDGSLTESFGEGFTDVTTSNLKDLFKINKSRNSNDENI